MKLVLHETPEAYETEFLKARAKLMECGLTFAQWCKNNGYSRQIGAAAMRGRSIGRKSIEIRTKLLRETLGNG